MLSAYRPVHRPTTRAARRPTDRTLMFGGAATTYPAAKFTGTPSGITSATGIAVTVVTPYTMAITFKLHDLGFASSNDFLLYTSTTSYDNRYSGLAVSYDGGGTPYLTMNTRNSTNFLKTDTVALSFETEYRFVGVWNTTTDRKGYLDGALRAGLTETATRSDAALGANSLVCAGYLNKSVPIYRVGSSVTLSDAQVWSKALTADDVAYDNTNRQSFAYNRSGTSLVAGDLEVAWPMNEGTGTSIDDLSGNTFDGTVGVGAGGKADFWSDTVTVNPVRS